MHNGIRQIANLFKSTKDLNQAHANAEPILHELVNDPIFLSLVIEQNLSDPAFLKRKRHYPTLAFPVFKNDAIDIIINVFPHLPDRSTDYSFQSIHHHGNLKLSTIGLSGPGYSSILFDPGYEIDASTEITTMKMAEFYQNERDQYTFCDAFVPHVVFYPTEMSSTLVLWSKSSKSVLNKIKSKVPNAWSKKISGVLNAAGMRKALDLNLPEYYDFYPEGGAIKALKTRIGYPEGSNENFIQNVFYYMQSVGYENKDFLLNLKKNNKTTALEKKWIDRFLDGDQIEALFEEIHVNIDPKVNCLKSEILEAAKGE